MDEFNNQNPLNNGEYTYKKEDIVQDEPATSAPKQEFSGVPHFGNGAFVPPSYVKEKKNHSTATVIISAVLAAVIGFSAAFASMFLLYNKTRVFSSGKNTNVNINVDSQVESVVQAVSEKASDSVVGIRTTYSVMNFFGGSQSSTGEGSGVVYSKDGYIITNYHVIEYALRANNSKIEVFVGKKDSKSYDASVVGYNISADLAVLKIKANDLSEVEFDNSDDLAVGQYCITIGAPGGLEFMGSVTYGVISGLNRIVSTTNSLPLIQTDAAINPGNSGGALLNTSGKLIGINSSKIVSEEFEGMGFAIPSNSVKEICDKIIKKQNEPEPYIGVSISEKYTAQILKYYGYPAGAVVMSVDNDSPAANAGIQRGDIITEFNSVEISEYTKFADALNDCEPGQKVSAKIYRNGNIYDVEITVASNN